MSERERYPAGVPCWIETLQADPRGALNFYGALFGWELVGPGPMPGEPPGQYFVARVRGRDVAGIGSLRDRGSAPAPAWSTYVRVDSADETARRAKDAGGSVRDGSPGAGRPHWSVGFWVDSADATAEQAVRLGGTVIVPPHDEPGFRSAVLADPQGAAFSVSKLTGVS